MEPHPAAALAGTAREWREAMAVSAAMLAVLTIYKSIEFSITGSLAVNLLELVGTLAGLICVWLARTANITSWAFSIVCNLCLGFYYWGIDLPGQSLLNLIYFMPISVWGWYNWAFGGEQRSEKPITRMTAAGRVAMVLAVVAISAVVLAGLDWLVPGSKYPLLDATVVGASVVAQYLLGRKQVESWWLWLGPVNALSILLFFLAGAYVVMALYLAYLIHAAFAIHRWKEVSDVR